MASRFPECNHIKFIAWGRSRHDIINQPPSVYTWRGWLYSVISIFICGFESSRSVFCTTLIISELHYLKFGFLFLDHKFRKYGWLSRYLSKKCPNVVHRRSEYSQRARSKSHRRTYISTKLMIQKMLSNNFKWNNYKSDLLYIFICGSIDNIYVCFYETNIFFCRYKFKELEQNR